MHLGVLLLVLGPDNFILPSLIVTVTVLMACRNLVQNKMEEPESHKKRGAGS